MENSLEKRLLVQIKDVDFAEAQERMYKIRNEYLYVQRKKEALDYRMGEICEVMAALLVKFPTLKLDKEG